jgi:hypothetical protein
MFLPETKGRPAEDTQKMSARPPPGSAGGGRQVIPTQPRPCDKIAVALLPGPQQMPPERAKTEAETRAPLD